MDPTGFFLYARERQAVLMRRRSGQARPWTEDHILDTYRFCNIYREDDATTQWLARWVRDPLASRPEVLLAVVLFRWFNRIGTGEAIFRQTVGLNDRGRVGTPWSYLLETGETEPMEHAIRRFCGRGPYVTGAYIIKTPDGMDKVRGVLWCVDQFCRLSVSARPDKMFGDRLMGWREMADTLLGSRGSYRLEDVWQWLREFPYLGDFMAYEIVTDLRHTDLLRDAPDIYTWANPGPGAMRGLNRLHGRDLHHRQPKHVFVCEMRDLLRLANEDFKHIWPHRTGHDVEMRDIEHTLCEFDKYRRVELGEGRPRGKYS